MDFYIALREGLGSLGLVLLPLLVLAALVRWARGSGRSACMGIAMVFCSFAPDPVLERSLQVVREAQEEQCEEEGEGDDLERRGGDRADGVGDGSALRDGTSALDGNDDGAGTGPGER